MTKKRDSAKREAKRPAVPKALVGWKRPGQWKWSQSYWRRSNKLWAGLANTPEALGSMYPFTGCRNPVPAALCPLPRPLRPGESVKVVIVKAVKKKGRP